MSSPVRGLRGEPKCGHSILDALIRGPRAKYSVGWCCTGPIDESRVLRYLCLFFPFAYFFRGFGISGSRCFQSSS
jgi:hypothetical protein